MKVYETKAVPATTREILIKRKCDLCGIESKSSDWNAGFYEVNETEIKITMKQKEGSSYPEGGSGTEYEIDLCPSCFTNRMIPWLKSKGAEIKEREWDW